MTLSAICEPIDSGLPGLVSLSLDLRRASGGDGSRLGGSGGGCRHAGAMRREVRDSQTRGPDHTV